MIVYPPRTDNPLNAIKPVSLRDQVFNAIQNAIVEGHLRPGDHIREQELTKSLKVSRTPVREALALLDREGLVRLEPNRGWFVQEFDERDVREIFIMRTTLENLGAELIVPLLEPKHITHLEALIQKQIEAVEQHQQTGALDLEFHCYLMKTTGNRRLLNAWQAIAFQYTMIFSYLQYLALETGKQRMIQSHVGILDALKARRVEPIVQINREVNAQTVELCIQGYHIYKQNRENRA
jgi:DNA-binding GntR family transcriptional regulator